MFPLLIFLSKYYSLCMQKLVCVTIVPKLFLWESWVVQGLIVNLTMKCIQTQLNTQANAYCCIYSFLFVLHSEYFLFIYLKDFRLFFFFFFNSSVCCYRASKVALSGKEPNCRNRNQFSYLFASVRHCGSQLVGSPNYVFFPGDASGKEPTCQCRRCKRHGFDPWVRKIPWRRA